MPPIDPITIRMAADSKDEAEILFYGTIGQSWFDEDATTAKSFMQQLKALGTIKTLNLRFNSPGGSVFEGFTIYNVLKDHPARKKGSIDGVAASIASVIAMACDELEIAANAMIMIHEPSAMVGGTSRDMRKVADLLDDMRDNSAGIYATRSKGSVDSFKAAMAEETWYTAERAKAAGLVDSIKPDIKVAASWEGDLSMFSKVPDWAKHRLKEMEAHATMTIQNPTPTPHVATAGAVTTPVAQTVATTPTQTAPAAVPANPPATPPAAPVAPPVIPPTNQGAAPDPVMLERKRTTDIYAACRMSGQEDKAQGFIESGALIETVRESLFATMCATRQPVGGAPAGQQQQSASSDPDAAYKSEYQANAAMYSQMGLNEAGYVRSRKAEMSGTLALGK